MANLKDLKTRIGSVKSTQKITRAMQMVAASKLRRAQERAEAARPYTEKMNRMVSSLAANIVPETAPDLLAGRKKDSVHLLIVATADRGLCGGFNSSIARAAKQKIQMLHDAGKEVKIITVGKKGLEQLRFRFEMLIAHKIDTSQKKIPDYEDASDIASRIIDMFENGVVDSCSIVYNKFISVVVQDITFQSLIPLEMPDVKNETSAVYSYEPEEKEILADLLPKNIAVQIFHALLENAASEQGARMSAMDNATRNAGEMIDRLTLTYNRTRQAAITTELIEIIAGAEAV